MSVNAIGSYDWQPRDDADQFPAPLLYVGWDDHLMFCAPVCLALPPDLPFGALIETVLPEVYGEHPDFARIDWNNALWFKSGAAWRPDPRGSLQDNGLRHKDVLRLRTPGLHGIAGSAS
jgi:phenol hydroxylase P4 protein